ncbi:hypothetical protein [Algoriphagus sp.]|uniref:hypothetical protein n=1 Tax=Algoriphagus sp. TaxID=1872435 RepID=UPI00261F7016|nr:hypothetical protein [Algoriphagus sp.]
MKSLSQLKINGFPGFNSITLTVQGLIGKWLYFFGIERSLQILMFNQNVSSSQFFPGMIIWDDVPQPFLPQLNVGKYKFSILSYPNKLQVELLDQF